MLKHYRIAGLTVAMDTFGRTEKQAKAYITGSSNMADIVIANCADEMKKQYPHLSLDECEYINTAAQFYNSILSFDAMMLHASAIAMDGYAFLFSAPSGTGKSTHTTLWREVYGYGRALMLNDDKPALRRENGRWYAYGTPWSGKTDQNLNLRVPLGGVCILERGENNKIVPFHGINAIYEVLQQTVRPYGPEGRARVLEHIKDLIENVPIWKLRCNMEEDAARVSHDVMYQAAKEKWPEG